MENFYIENVAKYAPLEKIPSILKKIEDEAKKSIIKESPFSLALENDNGKVYRVANLNLIIRNGIITPIKNEILRKLDVNEKTHNSDLFYMCLKRDAVFKIVKEGKKLEKELLEPRTTDVISSVLLNEIQDIKKIKKNTVRNEFYSARSENGSFGVLNLDEFVDRRFGTPMLELVSKYLQEKYIPISNSSYFNEKFKFFDVFDTITLPQTIIPNRFVVSSIAIETDRRIKKKREMSKNEKLELNEKLKTLAEKLSDEMTPVILEEIKEVKRGKASVYLKHELGKNVFNWNNFLNRKLGYNLGLSEWIVGTLFPFPENEIVLKNPIYSALVFKYNEKGDSINAETGKKIANEIVNVASSYFDKINDKLNAIFMEWGFTNSLGAYQERFADGSILKIVEINPFLWMFCDKVNEEIFKKLPFSEKPVYSDFGKEIYKTNTWEVAWA
jgi:hypothetical protein